jgi:hypothetical protein
MFYNPILLQMLTFDLKRGLKTLHISPRGILIEILSSFAGSAAIGDATAETATAAPSAGRNGLMLTRQQVIPIEERELNILYQLVLKNEARTTTPFLRAHCQSPAVPGTITTHSQGVTMPSIELPPAPVPEEEEGKVTTPKGSEEPSQVSPGPDKMLQFKVKRGISLTNLPEAGDNLGLHFEASPHDVKVSRVCAGALLGSINMLNHAFQTARL